MSVRLCLREPIPEIEVAASHLRDAVAAHNSGHKALADMLFRRADDRAVWLWLDSVWGKQTDYNRPRRWSRADPVTAPDRSLARRPTAETIRQVHLRDGHYCRFCKIPVISGKIRAAARKAYPDAVPWNGTNATQHAGFQCMWAQYDHIVPHSRGGSSNLDNIYLTCAACNYGRGSYLLEEVGLVHPGLHPPRQGDWNGLEHFRLDGVTPPSQHPAAPPPAPDRPACGAG